MKFSLKFLATLFIVFGNPFSSCAWEDEPTYGKIHFQELTSHNGEISLSAYWIFTDSLLVLDSLNVSLPDQWSLSSHNFKGVDEWYVKGDSIVLNMVINYPYDTTSFDSCPYYPLDIRFSQTMLRKDGSVYVSNLYGKVFFTPWNTIEVWDVFDYHRQGRVWKIPYGSSPNRVFIHKDSVPTSDIDPNDTIVHDWQEDYQLVDYEGLPFYVKMMPIHPDSLELWDSIYTDSIYQNSHGKWGPNYQGTFTGTLQFDVLDETGTGTVRVPMSGITIELHERDFHPWQRTKKIGETESGTDGSFSITFNENQAGEGAGLDLELHFKARNKTHKFKVIRHKSIDKFDLSFINQAITSSMNMNNIFGAIRTGNSGTMALGTIVLVDNGFNVCSKMEDGFRFASDNDADADIMSGVGRGNLNVFVDNLTLGNVFNSVVMLGGPKISLTVAGARRERTPYHEWGHFYMWALQGGTWITLLDDFSCNPSAWGSHSDNRMQHHSFAWTEGFADAIRNILDTHYSNEDTEFGLINPMILASGSPLLNSYEVRRTLPAVVTIGVKNEYNIACAIYDMWDGPNTVVDATGNELTSGARMGLPNAHPNNDRLLNGNAIAVAGDWDKPDDVEITFKDLMRPLVYDRFKNIYGYSDHLMNYVFDDDCIKRSGVARCLAENRVVNDIVGYDNDRVNFNTAITSDMIYRTMPILDFGKSIICISGKHEYTYLSNPIDVTAGQRTSVPHLTFISEFSGLELPNKYITDDLSLGFNFPSGPNPTPTTLAINNTSVAYSFDLTMETCGEVDWQLGNTILLMGRNDGSKQGNLIFNENSRLISSTDNIIHINNNSKLTIEEGAELVIHPGTTIILDGPNAILEIRGNLVLEEGAVFKPIAGANGQGFVIFDISDVANSTDAKEKIQVNNNTKMTFEASSQSTKVLEIRGNGLWLDDNNKTFEFAIKNGRAEIEQNAYLNLGCKSIFDGAYVSKFAGGGNYKGVYLWGHPGTRVDFSTFTGGVIGLQYSSTRFGTRLKVNSSVFEENFYALKVKGGGVTIKNSFLNDNTGYGLHAESILIPSFVYSTEFNSNDYQGISFASNDLAKMSVIGCDVNNNPNGMIFISRNDLRIKCSNFLGLSTSPYTLDMYAGHLMTSSKLDAGWNKFTNSEENIILNKYWGAPNFFTDNGYNQFSSATGGGQGQLGITGNQNNVPLGPPPHSVAANYNCWDANSMTNNAPSLDNTDVNSRMNGRINYSDINSMSLSSFASERNIECPTLDEEAAGGLNSGDGNLFASEGTLISTTNFSFTPISIAVDSVLKWCGDTNNVLEDIMEYWGEVLTFTEYPLPLTETDAKYIDIASTQMLSVVGQHFADKDKVDSNDINTILVQNAFDYIGHWVDTLATADTSTPHSFDIREKMNLKKAHLNMSLNELSTASTILNSLGSWAEPVTLDIADYWLCQIGQFEYLNLHPFDYHVLDSLPDCGDSIGLIQWEDGKLDIKKKAETASIKVYPNPASSEISIDLLNRPAGIYNVSFTDVMGKKVIEDVEINWYDSSEKPKVDIHTMTSGTYFIKVRNEVGNEFVTKIIVSKDSKK